TLAQHERGHEPMHSMKVRKAKESVAREDLEAAACVTCAILEEAAAQPVRETRGITLGDIVLSLQALAHDDAELDVAPRRFVAIQQFRKFARWVLPGAIKDGDRLALCLKDARADCGALAAILWVPDDPELRDRALEVQESVDRCVFGSVIDEDHLVGAPLE